MSNSYFQFKQFRIEQGNCAMKVSTDACLQGASAPVPESAKTVLDIGCGTGLLSLMLAQRFPQVTIDAIEIDAGAAQQAAANVAASPWHNRIRVVNANVNEFNPPHQYDYIICNPPFFINSLKGPTQQRNNARHNTSLTQEHLVAALARLLAPNGIACFMWPVKEHDTWQEQLYKSGFFLQDILVVRDKESAPVLRCISTCSRTPAASVGREEITIYNPDRNYTETFAQLLQPFYLKL